MKKLTIFLGLFIAIILVACGSDKNEELNTNDINSPVTADGELDTANLPKFKVMGELYHDFGTITQGEKVRHTFVVENAGNSPLIISNAKGSCGCTVPTVTNDPVNPGETTEIVVEFNSEGKSGPFTKTVNITANTFPTMNYIYVKGEIIAPSEN